MQFGTFLLDACWKLTQFEPLAASVCNFSSLKQPSRVFRGDFPDLFTAARLTKKSVKFACALSRIAVTFFQQKTERYGQHVDASNAAERVSLAEWVSALLMLMMKSNNVASTSLNTHAQVV